jgi:hypothetical protein
VNLALLPGTSETVDDVVPEAFYDAKGEDAPSAVPEFFGDTILVNGMAWPKLEVAAGDYTFRCSTALTPGSMSCLCGCDAGRHGRRIAAGSPHHH